jgi:hypothetical protein
MQCTIIQRPYAYNYCKLCSILHLVRMLVFYMRAPGLNIYMYMRGKYTNSHLEKYINRKAIIHLIPHLKIIVD